MKAKVGLGVFFALAVGAASAAPAFNRLDVDASSLPDGSLVGGLLQTRVAERCGVTTGARVFAVRYRLDPGIGGETARVSVSSNGAEIAAGRVRGLVAGTGVLLKRLRFEIGGFSVEPGESVFAPAKEFRSAYTCRHFQNGYMDMPAEAYCRYAEDLALDGINGFQFQVDLDVGDLRAESADYRAEFDRKTKVIVDRIRELDCNLTVFGGNNQLPRDSPEELRGVPNSDPKRGNLGFNGCPAKPEAERRMLEQTRQALPRLAVLKPDYVMYWPFDEGGCECEVCRPWGGKGFIRLSEKLHAINRSVRPDAKVILSTWVFHDDDFEGLWKHLETCGGIDYVLCDAHGDFPKYPLEHKLPGRTRLITFPEISMWGRDPWGGFGATMMPRRFERLFRQAERVSNGFAYYSEGLYEDVNKAIVTAFNVDPSRSVDGILADYARAHFPGSDPDDFVRLALLLEETHPICGKGRSLKNLDAARVHEAEAIAQRMDEQILPTMRKSWRWRQVLLRTRIDCRMAEEQRRDPESARPHFEELTDIYHVRRQLDLFRKGRHKGYTCPHFGK